MARIGGLIDVSSPLSVQPLLEGWVKSMTSDAQSCAACCIGPVGFWNTEASAVSLASDAGLIAAVEGRFFDSDKAAPRSAPAHALLDGYRKHGFTEALKRINGDFAAALFDSSSGALWLARDRVGHRPLYYTRLEHRFAFASRIGSLLLLPGVSRAPNRRYVAVFAGSHYRYIDNHPEESPFAEISQVPAGVAIEVRDGTVRAERYWSLTESPDFDAGEYELAHRYRELLIDAVKVRLAQAPAPAFTLSGGLDSSSILSCAAEVSGRRQYAFSSVYSDKTYDESDDIEGFVRERVERWQAVPIEGFDLFGTVRSMVKANDEPVATATWLSHYLLTETVHKSGFGSLFGGLGGDELNAGEYEYFIFHFADLRQHASPAALQHEIEEWARYHDHPIYRKDAAAAQRLLARFTDPGALGKVLLDRDRLTRYYATVRRDYYDLHAFEPILDHPFHSWLKNRTYQDIFRETAPCCLRAEDRNCMHFGLEHFNPFFDHRLIEFMFRVPGSMKIRDGITKVLLREAMRGILPEATRTRVKKTGWNAPAHLWFSGADYTNVADLVHSRRFRERGIYDVDEVLRLLAEHRDIVHSGQPRENHMMFLWQLLNLELWFQEVVERPV
jgi:asparagine synthase (glutamine-hydrolysing)